VHASYNNCVILVLEKSGQSSIYYVF